MTYPRFTAYPPWEQTTTSELNVEMECQLYEYDDGSPILAVRPHRTRLIIEGLDARMAPYLAAVHALVAQEPDMLGPRGHAS